jgi:hypothetical protein
MYTFKFTLLAVLGCVGIIAASPIENRNLAAAIKPVISAVDPILYVPEYGTVSWELLT